MSKVNYTKIGAFAVAGGLATVAALSTASYATMTKKTEKYDAFFAESVQGLEEGSSVKFRGVTLGVVDAIEVAPDGRHVKVTTELVDDAVERIHLNDDRGQALVLCAQLSPVGLTGTKIVQLDLFEPDMCTEPSALPFSVSRRTLASTSSTMEDLSIAVRELAKTAPRIAEDLALLVDRVSRFIGDVDHQESPATLAATLAQVHETLVRFDGKLAAVDTQRMSQQAGATMREIESTSAIIGRIVGRLDEHQGLLARLELASTAFGDAATGLDGSSEEIGEALQSVSEAAQAVRRLADALERDPDMLLKGRAELSR
jgi:ABC-type transporter Mla subunit MlaD